MNKILLLEDDVSLVDGLAYALEREGFALEVARSVKDAGKKLQAFGEYDLLLLDVSLPDGNGFTICEEVRASGNQVPILFLTASDEEVNIIRGLDSGGDDYLTKPFRLGELCSRIRALLRRSKMGNSAKSQGDILYSGPLEIHLLEGRVQKNGAPLELTAIEYRLLCLLVKNKNRVLTRNVILDELWDGKGNFVDDNTLSVHIRRLREKIEDDPSVPRLLLTVRGFGYQWKEEQA